MIYDSNKDSVLKCDNAFVMFVSLPEREKGYYDYDPCRRHVIVLNNKLIGKEDQIKTAINCLKERLFSVLDSTPFQNLLKFKVFLFYDEDQSKAFDSTYFQMIAKEEEANSNEKLTNSRKIGTGTGRFN